MLRDMRWEVGIFLLGMVLIIAAIATATIAQNEASTYLPAAFGPDQFLVGTNEVEPNNSFGEANGALDSGIVYTALPNDANDFFFFESVDTGDIVVEVSGLSAVEAKVSLFQEVEGATPELLAETNSPPPDFKLVGRWPAGKFFILVHVSEADPAGSNTPYTLIVTYLLPPTPTPVPVGTDRPTETPTPTIIPTATREPTDETPTPTPTPPR